MKMEDVLGGSIFNHLLVFINQAAYRYLIFISAIFEPGTVQVVVLDSKINVPVVNIASKIASI